MENSKIEWTDHTFNPWWGCAKVSPGCSNCYAETFAKRTGNPVWGSIAPRRFFGPKHWQAPLLWNETARAEGIRRRVFCASMADVFESREDLIRPRAQLLELIKETRSLDWLLLTKRPHNVSRMMSLLPRNVWLGTSAEDQKRWDERLPALMAVPARVHFVSAEPLLGPIKMHSLRPDWLIVGGESGHRARPMDPQWVLDLRDQCGPETKFFFKQWGGVRKSETGRTLEGELHDAMPLAGW